MHALGAGMSVKIMARVWAHSRRKDGELLVMLALADFANDASECWPSISVLAAKARLTERQTRRVLSKLEEVGEIRRLKSNGGRHRRNHYFITLSENPDNITGKELQGKNNSVIGDTKTLTPMSGALTHQGTVNKICSESDRQILRFETGAKAPLSSSIPKGKKTTRRGVPPELQPAVTRIVARINELAGTHYRDDKPDALGNLLARLRAGRTEAECLTVVEGRHAAWTDNDKMLEYFRPSTAKITSRTTCKRPSAPMARTSRRSRIQKKDFYQCLKKPIPLTSQCPKPWPSSKKQSRLTNRR